MFLILKISNSFTKLNVSLTGHLYKIYYYINRKCFFYYNIII